MAIRDFRRIQSLKVQPSDNANRITGVLADGRTYSVNQRVLNRFKDAAEIKAAIEKFLNEPVAIWFHKNRDSTWAVATGTEPAVWPEDETIAPKGG
jgi:hypothetical protein